MSIVLQSTGGGSVTINEPSTASNYTQTLPAATGTVVVAGANSSVVSGTAVASTSGTSIDFNSIPSWVKRITVMFNEVSTSGTSQLQAQLGTASSFENTGYLSTKIQFFAGTNAVTSLTSGHCIVGGAADNVFSGILTFSLVSGNIWIGSSQGKQSTLYMSMGNSSKTLASPLTRLRITTVNGTDTFDAGSINILYE
jgi:hypothetical protein